MDRLRTDSARTPARLLRSRSLSLQFFEFWECGKCRVLAELVHLGVGCIDEAVELARYINRRTGLGAGIVPIATPRIIAQARDVAVAGPHPLELRRRHRRV